MNNKYLIDANVLSTHAVGEIINTDFFNDNCIVIDEIAYELTETSVGAMTKRVSTPVDAQTLLHLQKIVDELIRFDILKTDHGNGDALLLATALAIKSGTKLQASLPFMQDHPVIVTNERQVDTYAKSKGLDVINGKEFLDILNSSQNINNHANKKSAVEL